MVKTVPVDARATTGTSSSADVVLVTALGVFEYFDYLCFRWADDVIQIIWRFLVLLCYGIAPFSEAPGKTILLQYI